MTTAQISLPFITADATGPKHLETTLPRAKFNEMTADLVEATMGQMCIRDRFHSRDEVEKYWEDVDNSHYKQWQAGKITVEEYCKISPYGYESWSCSY